MSIWNLQFAQGEDTVSSVLEGLPLSMREAAATPVEEHLAGAMEQPDEYFTTQLPEDLRTHLSTKDVDVLNKTVDQLLSNSGILSEVQMGENETLRNVLASRETVLRLMGWVLYGLGDEGQREDPMHLESASEDADADTSASVSGRSSEVERESSASPVTAYEEEEPMSAGSRLGGVPPKGAIPHFSNAMEVLDFDDGKMDKDRGQGARERYPQVSTEILLGDKPDLAETLFSHEKASTRPDLCPNPEDVLVPVWEKFLGATPRELQIRQLQAGYFVKIMGKLLNSRRGVDVLDTILHVQNLVPRMVKLAPYCTPLGELLLTMLQLPSPPKWREQYREGTEEHKYGFVRSPLSQAVPELVDLLRWDSEAGVRGHEVAGEVLRNALALNVSPMSVASTYLEDVADRMDTDDFAEDQTRLLRAWRGNELARQLAHGDTVARFVDYITYVPADDSTQEDISRCLSSSHHTMAVLIDLIRKNNSDYVEQQILTWARIRETQEAAVAARGSTLTEENLRRFDELEKSKDDKPKGPHEFAFENVSQSQMDDADEPIFNTSHMDLDAEPTPSQEAPFEAHMPTHNHHVETMIDDDDNGPCVVDLSAVLVQLSAVFPTLQGLLQNPRTMRLAVIQKLQAASQLPVFTSERLRICGLYAELLHCSNMRLMNEARPSELYGSDGRLAGGWAAASVLADVLSGDSNDKDSVHLSSKGSMNGIDNGKDTSAAQDDPARTDEAPTPKPHEAPHVEEQETTSANATPTKRNRTPKNSRSPRTAHADLSRILLDERGGGSSSQGTPLSGPSSPQALLSVAEQELIRSLVQDGAVHGDDALTASQVQGATVPPGVLLKLRFLTNAIVPSLIDLFFAFHNNSLLHNVVFDLLQQIFNTRLTQREPVALVTQALDDAALASRLVDAFSLRQSRGASHREKERDTLKESAGDAEMAEGEATDGATQSSAERPTNTQTQPAYYGHLILIADELVKLETQLEETGDLQPLKRYLPARWEAFASTMLDEMHRRDEATLGKDPRVVQQANDAAVNNLLAAWQVQSANASKYAPMVPADEGSESEAGNPNAAFGLSSIVVHSDEEDSDSDHRDSESDESDPDMPLGSADQENTILRPSSSLILRRRAARALHQSDSAHRAWSDDDEDDEEDDSDAPAKGGWLRASQDPSLDLHDFDLVPVEPGSNPDAGGDDIGGDDIGDGDDFGDFAAPMPSAGSYEPAPVLNTSEAHGCFTRSDQSASDRLDPQ